MFLGDAHERNERNERKTWTVIVICAAMMAAEIIGGLWFGSVALVADGLHMSTHACALLIAVLAYTYSRRYVNDARLTFGTGKFGDLAAFTSAIGLAIIALKESWQQAIERLTFVQIPEPALRAGDYPHHLFGGQRQRVMITIAIYSPARGTPTRAA